MTMPQAYPATTDPRSHSSPSFDAFFSYGFRPFFLGAAVYAVLLMSVWLLWVVTAGAGQGAQWLPVAGSPYAWHAHEMVYGFAAAAVAGFLLTAVPNWTGTLPLSGAPLVVLFAVWISGRAALALSGFLPAWIAAGIDILFIPLLGGTAARQLFTKPAVKNLIFLVFLGVLALGNIVFHLGTLGIVPIDPLAIVRAALLMVAALIAIIGGRIIPAFTHNWLHLNGVAGPMPRRIGWIDALSVFSIATYALLQASGGPSILVGSVALVAAVINAVRLSLWRGWATRHAPIVWVLHFGYAWMVAGLLLGAASSLTGSIPAAAASHAIGTGAIGTMIMGVMSRAALGHTGRPLVAPQTIVLSYILVSLAALLRVAGPLAAPQFLTIEYTMAGIAWIAAFGLFAAVYGPILTTPRVHMKMARTRG